MPCWGPALLFCLASGVFAGRPTDISIEDHWSRPVGEPCSFAAPSLLSESSRLRSECLPSLFNPDEAEVFILTPVSISFDVREISDGEHPGGEEESYPSQVPIFNGLSLNPTESRDSNLDDTLENIVVNFLNFKNLDGEIVTVRFYRWDSDQKESLMNSGAIALSGSVMLVPEPSAVILAAASLVVLLRRGLPLPR